MKIGLVHAGNMGAALAAANADVIWASEGRSRETASRAGEVGAFDVGELSRHVTGFWKVG